MKWQWWLAIVVGGLALVLGFWLVSASWRNKISSDACRKQAEKFSSKIFDKKIKEFIEKVS